MMKTHDIDVVAFEADPDAWIVVALMMACNDIERLVYLRMLYQAEEKQQIAGNFSQSVGGYIMGVLVGHVSEAFLVVRNIGQGKPIWNVIQNNAPLLQAYTKVAAYIDDTVGANGQSPYEMSLKRWKQYRNLVAFHYNHQQSGREIKPALHKVAAAYKTSRTWEGEGNEATFHELGYEVIDAIASVEMGYPFPNTNGDMVKDLVAELEKMQRELRIFAHHLILRYTEMYKAP